MYTVAAQLQVGLTFFKINILGILNCLNMFQSMIILSFFNLVMRLKNRKLIQLKR